MSHAPEILDKVALQTIEMDSLRVTTNVLMGSISLEKVIANEPNVMGEVDDRALRSSPSCQPPVASHWWR